MSPGVTRAVVVIAYFIVVLAVGAAAFRKTGEGSEEYFLGGRSARTLVLFMALFGTNVTPFVLMGIPGLAYHQGIGVFGLNAAIIVLGVPLTIWLIGYPAWREAKRLRVVSPAELYARRLGSPALGRLLFVVFFIYTVPYMVTAVSGVGIAVAILSEDALSFEWASAAILALTLLYTSTGGMRATMWTNVFQGAVFLGFTLYAFARFSIDGGGLGAMSEAVMAADARLLDTPNAGRFAPGPWASWGLAISLTVIAFPHMLVRIFAASDEAALKNSARLYPFAMILLWLPVVFFGVWGAVEVPGLAGKASDEVFVRMVMRHMGPAMQGLALAGILAAVMSTLDAQMLTLGSMLSRDLLRSGERPSWDERKEVRVGRVFLVGLAGITYAIVLLRPASIFDIAKVAFYGYCTTVPTLLFGLRWSAFNARAAIVSVLAGNAALVAAVVGWLPTDQLLPVAWSLGAAVLAPLPFIERRSRVRR